jgi:hypothetical protein
MYTINVEVAIRFNGTGINTTDDRPHTANNATYDNVRM